MMQFVLILVPLVVVGSDLNRDTTLDFNRPSVVDVELPDRLNWEIGASGPQWQLGQGRSSDGQKFLPNVASSPLAEQPYAVDSSGELEELSDRPSRAGTIFILTASLVSVVGSLAVLSWIR